VIAVALVGLLVANERVFAPRVRNAVEAARVIRDAHEAMLDKETSLRGWLLSGDDRYLMPYREGAEALGALNASAQRLLGSDRTTSGLLLDMRVAQTAWVDGWTGQALAAGDAGDEIVSPLLDEGKRLFDAYRAAYERLAHAAVDRRESALSQQEDAIRVTTGLAFLGTLVLAAGSLRRNRQLRRTLEPSLDAIGAQLARMADGDLTPAADIGGPSELREVGAGLNATASALADAREREAVSAEQMRVQNRQLSQVLRLAREVAGSLSLRYIVRGVCTAAAAIADDRRVVVWLREEDEAQVVAHADSDGPGLEAIGLDPVPLGEGVVGRAARFGRVDGHGSDLLVPAEGTDDRDRIAIPMVVGAEVVGVLEVVGTDASALPSQTLDVLEALAVQAATAVGAAKVHEHTETLAMTDALTHLPNRRRLEADLATEVGVSSRYGRPLGLAMLDVDHFKAYNDTLGHQAADVALQELAALLTRSVRTGDSVYRYGGEEIAVVMRETDAGAALQQAERLCQAVAHHFSGPDHPRAVTVSIGVASMPTHATGADALVAAADAALYKAKQAGRNRACTAPVPAT
jgi:diguanylate cyclase (GGDEF)-like protein